MSSSTDEVVSPVATERPQLIISAASINSEPASPAKVRARRASRDELLAELGGEEKEVGLLDLIGGFGR